MSAGGRGGGEHGGSGDHGAGGGMGGAKGSGGMGGGGNMAGTWGNRGPLQFMASTNLHPPVPGVGMARPIAPTPPPMAAFPQVGMGQPSMVPNHSLPGGYQSLFPQVAANPGFGPQGGIVPKGPSMGAVYARALMR